MDRTEICQGCGDATRGERFTSDDGRTLCLGCWKLALHFDGETGEDGTSYNSTEGIPFDRRLGGFRREPEYRTQPTTRK